MYGGSGRGRYGRPGDFHRKKQKRKQTPASMLSRQDKASYLHRFLQQKSEHTHFTPDDLEQKFKEGNLGDLKHYWEAFCREFNNPAGQRRGYRDHTSEPGVSSAETYIDECIRQASSFATRSPRRDQWQEEGQQINNRGEAPGSYPVSREGGRGYSDTPSGRDSYVPSGTPRGMLYIGNNSALADGGGYYPRNNTPSRDGALADGGGYYPRNNTPSRDSALSDGGGYYPRNNTPSRDMGGPVAEGAGQQNTGHTFALGDASKYFTQEPPPSGEPPGSYGQFSAPGTHDGHYPRDRIAPASYRGPVTGNIQLDQYDTRDPYAYRPDMQPGSNSHMDSHGRSAMVPPGGRQIVGRSHDNHKQLDKDTIQWLNPKEAEIGTFFINKVFLGADESDFWKPSHLEGTCTELLSFEELVPTTDLQRAVLVNNKGLPECLDMFCHFPADVDITLVCPKVESTKSGRYLFCYSHKQWWEKASDSEEEKPKEEEEEVEPQGCGCQDTLTINLVHPRNSSEIGCKLILLWYKEHVRIIFPSASLDKMSWTQVAQFGWFYDLSITVDWGDQDPADEAQDERKKYLSIFLSSLGLEGDQLLAQVSFQSLSPGVNFIGSLPGGDQHKEKGRLGLNRVKQLFHDIQWLPNSEYKSLCQSRRIGRYTGAEIVFKTVFSNDQWRARTLDNLQVVYPSCDYVKRCLEERPDRPQADEYGKMFGFLVRHLAQGNNSLLPILCDPDLDDAILLHANLLQRYQQVEAESGVHHYGWLITGSHTLGFSCWGGDSKSRRNSMRRYELSVMLKPFKKDSETGPITCAVDLKQIGLHFASCQAYVPTSFPFCPPEYPGGSAYVCTGTLRRIYQTGKFGFISDLECSETWDPTKEFDGQLPAHEVYLHVQNCIEKARRDGANLPHRTSQHLQDYVQHGAVFKFVAASQIAKDMGDRRNADQQLRVIYIQDITESSAVPEEEDNQDNFGSLFDTPEGHEQPWLLKQQDRDTDFKPRSFEARMKMLGIKTDEDFETCLLERVNKRVTMDPWKYGLQKGESDLETSWPMNPTKLANDQTWLEKHVWNKFGGKFPVLRGPHCPYMLGLEVQANREACFKGLD